MAIALMDTVSVAGLNGGTTAAKDTTGATFLAAALSTTAIALTFSDSHGNTWIPLTPQIQNAMRVRIYYVAAPIVGPGHTFSLGGTGVFGAVNVAWWSGITVTGTPIEAGGIGSAMTVVQPGGIIPTVGDLILTSLATEQTVSDANSSLTSIHKLAGGLDSATSYGQYFAWGICSPSSPTVPPGSIYFEASTDHASVIYYSAQLRLEYTTAVIDSFNLGVPTPVSGVIIVDLTSWLATHAPGRYTLSILTVTATGSSDSTMTSGFTLPLTVDPNAYATAILADTPVAYWRLDDAVGSLAAHDATNHGYVGTAEGTLAFGQPSVDGAGTGAACDGVNGTGILIAVPPPIAASMSVEAWVSLVGTGADAYTFIWCDGAALAYPLVVAVVSDGGAFLHALRLYVNFGAGAPGWITTGYSLPITTWIHLVVTWNGTNLIVYVNGGVVMTTAAYSGSTWVNVGSSGGMRSIGCAETLDHNSFNGVLDDVALYNYALTSVQVLAHYHGKIP